MGTNFVIPAVHKSKRVETLMTPEDDLSNLIGEYLGNEIKGVYDEVLDELYYYREQEQKKNEQ